MTEEETREHIKDILGPNPKTKLYFTPLLSYDFCREFRDKINWKEVDWNWLDCHWEKGKKFIREFGPKDYFDKPRKQKRRDPYNRERFYMYESGRY